MYEMILLHMENEYKREAVGYLVEHINSLAAECRPEVDCALDVMGSIASKSPEILEPYTEYIRETLYHMDLMTFSQVKFPGPSMFCLKKIMMGSYHRIYNTSCLQ